MEASLQQGISFNPCSNQQLPQFLQNPSLGFGFVAFFVVVCSVSCFVFLFLLVSHFINVLCLNEWPSLALSAVLPSIKRLLL